MVIYGSGLNNISASLGIEYSDKMLDGLSNPDTHSYCSYLTILS